MLRFDDAARTLELGVHDLLAAGASSGDLQISLAWSSATRMRAGQRAHTSWQRGRAEVEPSYASEVTVRHRVRVGDWEVVISGRIDGLYEEGDYTVVEELKSTALLEEQLGALGPADFPEWTRQLQLYLYFLEARGQPSVGRLVLASLLDGSWRVLHVRADPGIGAFVEARLAEMIARREARLAWYAIRRAAEIPFAHAEFRVGQEALCASIQAGLDAGQHLLLAAPTGTGKTATVLYGALQVAFRSDARVFFATSRGTQQRLAEETLAAMMARGLPLRAVSLRAREKMCLNDAVICRADACRFAASYHDKVRSAGLPEAAWADAPMRPERILAHGAEAEACPHALSLDLAADADVVVGDYNYIFDPGVRPSRLFEEGFERWIVVVDEAHNLPERAMGYLSPELPLSQARAAAAALAEHAALSADVAPFRALADEVVAWLEGGWERGGGADPAAWGGDDEVVWGEGAFACPIDRRLREELRVFAEQAEALALPYALMRLRGGLGGGLGGSGARAHLGRHAPTEATGPLQLPLFSRRVPDAPVEPPVEPPVDVLGEEESADEADLERVGPEPAGPGPAAEDPWQRLARGLLRMRGALERAGEETVVIWRRPNRTEGGMKLLCRDPSGALGPLYRELKASAMMSATLEPPQFYQDLLGLEPGRARSLRASSPFAAERLAVLVVPTVTTAYRHRSRDRAATAAAISESARAVPGNVAVFFSSFALLEDLAPLLDLGGRPCLVQSRGMGESARRDLLDAMAAGGEQVLLAVLGGVFSEGVDLPGRGLLGAVIVGLGLPSVGLERKLLQSWYEARYGQGFRYAFQVPGLARVVQAAGRVIRAPEDRGVVVLVDRRFLLNEIVEFFPPDWRPSRASRPGGLIEAHWTGSAVVELDEG